MCDMLLPLSDISIHALRKESDLPIVFNCAIWLLFQSTLSVRRATLAFQFIQALNEFQSTLSVRRATNTQGQDAGAARISIHALRKESDLVGGDRS